MHVLILSILACTPPNEDEPKHSDSAADTDTDTDTDTDSGANQPPSAPQVAISPGAPSDVVDLTVTVVTESFDPDGDPITYHYAWAVDGVAREDLTNTTVSQSETSDGQVWSVAVYPNDGTQDGEPGTAEVTVGNVPPVAPTIHLEPTLPVDNDPIVLVVDVPASDANGDTLTQTIDWYINGARNSAWRDLTTIEGRYVDGGETYRAVVTVSDGVASVSSEASVTVANNPPEIESITLSSASPADEDDITVNVRSSDPDGTSVTTTYAWYRDGVLATDVGDTSTVPADLTTVGEEWVVQVVVSDGLDTAEGTSETAIVIPWEGYVTTSTLALLIPADLGTATGTWAYDLLSYGGMLGNNECSLLWNIDAVDVTRPCRDCEWDFESDYVYDAAASDAGTGDWCAGLAVDAEGDLWYQGGTFPSFHAELYGDYVYASSYYYRQAYVQLFASYGSESSGSGTSGSASSFYFDVDTAGNIEVDVVVREYQYR